MSEVKPVTLEKDLQNTKQDIVSLKDRARELENWLLNNTQDHNWFQESSRYNDILFRLDLKKQKLQAINSGNITAPETKTMPTRTNHNGGF
jgi:hypothetical protein